MLRTPPTTPLTFSGRRSRGDILSALALAGLVTLIGACGGGDDGGGKPPDFEGPFAQLAGASRASFSLAAADVEITCLPKRTLEELEYEGRDKDGNALRLVIKDYKVGAMQLEYGIDKPQHVIEVSLAGGFKYKFFQHLRNDQDEVYNTRCDLTAAEDKIDGGTRYSGHLSCTLLFADPSSPNYAGTDQLNAFVDLVARYECER